MTSINIPPIFTFQTQSSIFTQFFRILSMKSPHNDPPDKVNAPLTSSTASPPPSDSPPQVNDSLTSSTASPPASDSPPQVNDSLTSSTASPPGSDSPPKVSSGGTVVPETDLDTSDEVAETDLERDSDETIVAETDLERDSDETIVAETDLERDSDETIVAETDLDSEEKIVAETVEIDSSAKKLCDICSAVMEAEYVEADCGHKYHSHCIAEKMWMCPYCDIDSNSLSDSETNLEIDSVLSSSSPMKLLCDLCASTIEQDAQQLKAKCGHIFHSHCIRGMLWCPRCKITPSASPRLMMIGDDATLAPKDSEINLYEDDDVFEEFNIDQEGELDEKEVKETTRHWEDDWDDDDLDYDFLKLLEKHKV